ncbi:hypothetical protein AbraCBS73388_011916 [Aspergillus brasiliensis]|uniref:Uncharacterized protein n=1 Tax=Aspergillus brasiliensis TaxID=319629 RepID=A0A9W6DQ76_9EURO|nr:hypothetical protein AbraCBS73388_011916 [Aspergillus brasiliensis]
MSSAVQQSNGSPLLRPRAVPGTKHLDDLTSISPLEKADSRRVRELTFLPSGRSTPIPDDAPPSVHSISTARKQARARTRIFYTIDYVPRVSHFDPRSEYRDFRGFYTLFWIALFIMVVTTMLRNIKDTGYPLRIRVWSLLSANVWSMGFSDVAMVVSSAVVLPLHHAIRKSGSLMRWGRGGMVVQSIFEAGWAILWIK